MWPFERRRDVLRIGRLRVELWRHEAAGLVQLAAQPLPARDGLSDALGALLADPSERRGGLDVLLESAWLPVIHLVTGQEVWAQTAVESLLRHRLSQAYDERDDAVANWAVAVDHRPGDRFGVGYGLSPRVTSAIDTACAAAGRTVHSLQPMWQWARRLRPVREGWWIWLEQDRAIAALLEQGRVVALQPAADIPRDAAQLERLIRIEQLRAGIELAPQEITLAGWSRPFELGTGARIRWTGVTAEEPAVLAAMAAGSPA